MFNIKTTLSGTVTKNIDGVFKQVSQDIVLGAQKLQTIRITNDMYLSFPHLYAEIILDNISMVIERFRIEITDDEKNVKRQWTFNIYKNSRVENENKDFNNNQFVYIIKGLSIPLTHLNKRITNTYEISATEQIKKIFNKSDSLFDINTKTKLLTTSIRWNRVNMNDFQFFNFLKKYIHLVNGYTFIPLFYLKDKLVNSKIVNELVLDNLLNITSDNVKYEVNFKDVTLDSDNYNIKEISNNRRNYLHTTQPYFNTIGGENRRSSGQFGDAILTDYINSPNVIINKDNMYKLGELYRNSTNMTINKITNGYYLEMVQLGNVFSMKNYENTEANGNITVENSYFNIIGYELTILSNESQSIMKGDLIVTKL